MNEAHEHDTADVHFLVCVLAQEVSHDGHMPGMFGIILVPAVTRQVGLTENILLFVDFQRKSQLFCKAFVLTHKLICLFSISMVLWLSQEPVQTSRDSHRK